MSKLKLCLCSLALSLCVLSVPTMEVHATEAGALTGDTSTETPEGGSEGSSSGSGHEASEEGLVYGTGDAIADIMQNERFEGAIESIQGITEFTDVWFTRIITFVAFFIISVSMLRNVLAGAYCANNKFWDKVHEAHETAAATSFQQLTQNFKSITSKNVGSMSKAVLTFIPDIKAWTDFEGDTIEPKAYFMKAIPQMLACIAIGIFIYNGYYRDTAATVGSMGSVLIERTLSSVNPESFVNKLFNTTGWPSWPTENDTSLQGQTELAICKELQSLVASNFSDVDSTQEKAQFVANTANFIRNLTEGDFQKFYDVAEDKEGKYSYKVTSIDSMATAKGVYDDASTTGTVIMGDEDNNGNVPFRVIVNDPVSTLGLASTKGHDGNSCLVVTGMFKYTSQATGKGKSNVNTDGWSGEDGAVVTTIEGVTVSPVGGTCSLTGGKALFINYEFNASELVTTSDGSKINSKELNIEGQPSTSIRINKGLLTIGNAELPIESDGTVYLGYIKYHGKNCGKVYIKAVAKN